VKNVVLLILDLHVKDAQSTVLMLIPALMEFTEMELVLDVT
jgi:hypothetical protein